MEKDCLHCTRTSLRLSNLSFSRYPLKNYLDIKLMKYNFEWDPKKAKTNKKKHKISFEQASTVFKDPKAISIFDEEHSEYEDRWITLGLSTSGYLLIVCHTYIQVEPDMVQIRIISSRKATKFEESQYW